MQLFSPTHVFFFKYEQWNDNIQGTISSVTITVANRDRSELTK
jgi:hypothetical protein